MNGLPLEQTAGDPDTLAPRDFDATMAEGDTTADFRDGPFAIFTTPIERNRFAINATAVGSLQEAPDGGAIFYTLQDVAFARSAEGFAAVVRELNAAWRAGR